VTSRRSRQRQSRSLDGQDRLRALGVGFVSVVLRRRGSGRRNVSTQQSSVTPSCAPCVPRAWRARHRRSVASSSRLRSEAATPGRIRSVVETGLRATACVTVGEESCAPMSWKTPKPPGRVKVRFAVPMYHLKRCNDRPRGQSRRRPARPCVPHAIFRLR